MKSNRPAYEQISAFKATAKQLVIQLRQNLITTAADLSEIQSRYDTLLQAEASSSDSDNPAFQENAQESGKYLRTLGKKLQKINALEKKTKNWRKVQRNITPTIPFDYERLPPELRTKILSYVPFYQRTTMMRVSTGMSGDILSSQVKEKLLYHASCQVLINLNSNPSLKKLKSVSYYDLCNMIKSLPDETKIIIDKRVTDNINREAPKLEGLVCNTPYDIKLCGGWLSTNLAISSITLFCVAVVMTMLLTLAKQTSSDNYPYCEDDCQTHLFNFSTAFYILSALTTTACLANYAAKINRFNTITTSKHSALRRFFDYEPDNPTEAPSDTEIKSESARHDADTVSISFQPSNEI